MQALRATLSKHPIVGNVVVYGSLYVGAEFLQQTYTKKVMVPEGSKPEPYDTGSLTRYGIMGTCVFPHTLYHAYKFLDKKFPGPTMSAAMMKLAVDSLVVTPINLTIFYTGMSAMEGADLFEEWKAKIVPTFLTASVFWVPAQLINFRFLPSHLRVVYVGACQIIWVSILCWFKRQKYE